MVPGKFMSMSQVKVFLLSCLVSLSLMGCTTETEYGKCVGILDDKDPSLKYEADVGNIAIGAVLFETVVVPAVVLLKDLQCPVGNHL